MKFPVVYMYDHSGDSHTLDDLKVLLGNERYGYCRKMKNEKAGLCSAYAFLLLRYVLKKEFGISGIPKLIYNEYGKPFLKEHPEVYFNLSHAKQFAVCAVSDLPIGVDIQDVRKLNYNTAHKYLTESELQNISAFKDNDVLNEELCRLWCIKESIGKCKGKGFGEGFTSLSAEEFINSGYVRYTKKKGYYISVCTTDRRYT